MSEKGKNTFTHQMLRNNHFSETKKQDQAVGNSDNSDTVKDEQNTVMMSTTDYHDAQLMVA